MYSKEIERGKMMNFKPVDRMMNSKNGHVHRLGHYLAYLWQYRGMLRTMMDKDLKGRFKYTALGYGWHLLNPLTQIIIYFLIFTMLFGRDIPNYWAYISTGMFAFTFASSCISGCSNEVVKNANMVTKMAFAREVLVISKVLVNLITLSISYILLMILMMISGVGITWCILFLPLIMVALTMFCMGCAFIFSALTVYLRDISNAIAIMMGCMMFAIPIVYLASQRVTPTMQLIWDINPLYHYIECIHNVFYLGIMPNMTNLTVGMIAAPISLFIGLYVFKKLEYGFAERL